ncbi:MAG: hypothetical protein L6290_07140 [Thermodesulfovibrionales bacterium]|nr:hypothetical protein [Thermodesulfovibrionales bacterium]
MKRSLHIKTMAIVIGLFVIPAVIYAQPDQVATKTPVLEQPCVCESTSLTKYSFIVKLKNEISSILKKVKSIITQQGGKFEGNTECGFFDGKSVLGIIKVKYRSISHNEIEIIIEDKPFIIPCQTIEAKIKKYLS